MKELFKTAGHTSAQTLDAMLPEEKFLPIQRVVDTQDQNKTIGYLFPNVEYKKGVVSDIVLTKDWIRDNEERLRKTASEWQEYENDTAQNPFSWIIPSGPLTTELVYRTQHDIGSLATEAQESWNNTIGKPTGFQLTSTITYYKRGNAKIRHNWNEEPQEIKMPEERAIAIIGSNDAIFDPLFYGILGKRYTNAAQIFEKYGTRVYLWTGTKGKTVLTLGLVNNGGGFDVDAGSDISIIRPARGITLAENILSNPRYEVRDE